LKTSSAALFAPLLAATLSCGVSFPDPALIQDLRILEVRAEPPEISVFLPGPAASTPQDLVRLRPNLAPVTLSVIAAHPDPNAQLSYSWIRCAPGFQGLPCDGSDQTPVRLQTSTSSSIQISPIAIALQEAASSSASGPKSLLSALSTFAQDPRDLLNGFYANIEVDASVVSASIAVDTQTLEATKRIVVFDPQIVRVSINQAQQLRASGMLPTMIDGYTLPGLCANVSAAQLDLISGFLAARKPNRSPVFRSVEVARRLLGVQGSTRALALGEPIEVGPDEELVLRGRVDDADKEAYQIIDDNCQLVPLHEVMSWSWFTGRGTLSKQRTTESVVPENDENHLTVYRAPPASQLREDVTVARIWSVLRDGRGGSVARVIDVVIVK
jgi:hypothetical protein